MYEQVDEDEFQHSYDISEFEDNSDEESQYQNEELDPGFMVEYEWDEDWEPEEPTKFELVREEMYPVYEQGRSDRDPNTLNILLIGTDGPRSDTIMVAQYNTQTNNAAMLSIPRDSYVRIPGWRYDKVNHAYASGGVNRLRNSVEDNFDIHIDHYARVDMESFERIIELFDGVEVEVAQDIIDYRDNSVFIEQGTHHLDASEALDYVRFRSDSSGDYGRMRRQQQVMLALLDDIVGAGSVDAYLEILEKVSPYVRTDIGPGVVMDYWQDFNNLSPSDITLRTLSGQAFNYRGFYIQLDLEECRQIARSLTY